MESDVHVVVMRLGRVLLCNLHFNTRIAKKKKKIQCIKKFLVIIQNPVTQILVILTVDS